VTAAALSYFIIHNCLLIVLLLLLHTGQARSGDWGWQDSH
jgi:hypothetical protein